MTDLVVAALYKFVTLEDFHALREPLLDRCIDAGVRGTLLLAREGINGAVAGSRAGVDSVLAYLKSDFRLADLARRESFHDHIPFNRMKVKLKREIVTMGVPGVDPNEQAGRYVDPADWNALIDDPAVLVLDTRNDYEVAIGTFKGAVNLHTATFREFPARVREHLSPDKNRKVAMFCTGGIRCEKASSFLLQEGYEEVFHLRGGILGYLEEVPAGESAWEGECFVFDNRVAVNQRLRKGRYDQCHGCRHPLDGRDKLSALYQRGVCCPACYHRLTDMQKARFAERQRQVELARRRRLRHIGAPLRQMKAVAGE